LNDIFVNALNRRFAPLRQIDTRLFDRVVRFHLTGHSDQGSSLFDAGD